MNENKLIAGKVEQAKETDYSILELTPEEFKRIRVVEDLPEVEILKPDNE